MELDHLQAGLMDRRIRLETTTTSQDAYGGKVETWSLLVEVWAQVVHLSGRELLLAAQFMPTAQVKFRIRYRADITEKSRIVYEAKNYNIGHIAEIGRRKGLEILAKRP